MKPYAAIYNWFEKFQAKGEYGDITDLKEGRNLSISRTVSGKKVTDIVMASPNFSSIAEYVSDDMYHNLDEILPEPDIELMEKAFKSHPWKVYEPKVKSNLFSENVPSNKNTKHEASNDDIPDFVPPESKLSSSSTTLDKLSSLAALEAKLKAPKSA